MFTMDYEERVRSMLVALGPGGTRDLAENALAWLGASAPDYSRLGGLAEVAALVDRKRPVVSNWNATESLKTPEPVFRVTATPIWDLEHWRDFGRAHPELMGPGFDPFEE